MRAEHARGAWIRLAFVAVVLAGTPVAAEARAPTAPQTVVHHPAVSLSLGERWLLSDSRRMIYGEPERHRRKPVVRPMREGG